jgi:lysophospholipase L1-like esterase
MIDYVKVLTTEMESAQLIIKILREELQYTVDDYKIGENIPTFRNEKSKVGQYTKGESASESASEWTEVLKKRHAILQQKQTSSCANSTVKPTSSTPPAITKYTVPVVNRFASLQDYHEPQECKAGISSYSSAQHLASLPHMNYKNIKKPRRNKSLYVNQRLSPNQQSNKPNLQTSKENEVQSIPTVINGVIWAHNDVKSNQKYTDSIEDSHIRGYGGIKEKEKSKRHRILLLGDSQARGCANLLKQKLNSEFDVSGIVKPGAKTSDILGINIDKEMAKYDIVVVCAGCNDISKNNAKEGLKNIINFVTRTSHTNIIVMEALHRHDLVDWSCVNQEIRLFNRLLAKRLKLYKQVSISSPNLGRQHFTRHGLHMNHLGKEKMCQEIADWVQRKFGAVVNAIPLNYGEDTVHEAATPVEATQLECEEDAAEIHGSETEKTSADPSLNCEVLAERDQHQEVRMSTRKRRPPVKLSNDFL